MAVCGRQAIGSELVLVQRSFSERMEITHNGRPAERRPRRHESIERTLLLVLLDPPEFGGSVRELARRLGEPEAEITTSCRPS